MKLIINEKQVTLLKKNTDFILSEQSDVQNYLNDMFDYFTNIWKSINSKPTAKERRFELYLTMKGARTPKYEPTKSEKYFKDTTYKSTYDEFEKTYFSNLNQTKVLYNLLNNTELFVADCGGIISQGVKQIKGEKLDCDSVNSGKFFYENTEYDFIKTFCCDLGWAYFIEECLDMNKLGCIRRLPNYNSKYVYALSNNRSGLRYFDESGTKKSIMIFSSGGFETRDENDKRVGAGNWRCDGDKFVTKDYVKV